ncbi:MAG TPA: M20 family metallo-hydrolase [Saprospiraceae bacterium]|nr:M20 family metallo-hydrolase [Saprospiraceae bacterium]
MLPIITSDITALLQKLIATPSFSKEEDKTGDLLEQFLRERGAEPHRKKHNVWVRNKYFTPGKPTLLLNSHHDTVKPNQGYTRDPFSPDIVDGKLYGLGSNDAGGALTCLLGAFLYFFEQKNLPFNLIYAATAEEEISGHDGVELILPDLGQVDFAIVGEPTQMQLAIAEKGLMVVDGLARGRAGHAAREEGESALYKALDDIAWIRNHEFPMTSEILGPVKMSVTIIQAGSQHNVVPDQCRFTVDVRVNEHYSLEEVLDCMRKHTQSELMPRSLRMRSSIIPLEHPLVRAGLSIGRTYYGSPTTSDKALMPFPALKMGPGDSARSHTADEFIYCSEIVQGVAIYVQLLQKLHETLG